MSDCLAVFAEPQETENPKKYGLRQILADTLGVSGVTARGYR